MKQQRLKPDIRKEAILVAAVSLAAVKGYANITRDGVAKKAGVTGSAIWYHFGTITELRAAVMHYAVQHQHLRVIAQGLAAQNPHAINASDELKQLARESI